MTWTIVVFLNAQFNTASEVLFELFNGFTPGSITLGIPTPPSVMGPPFRDTYQEMLGLENLHLGSLR